MGIGAMWLRGKGLRVRKFVPVGRLVVHGKWRNEQSGYGRKLRSNIWSVGGKDRKDRR